MTSSALRSDTCADPRPTRRLAGSRSALTAWAIAAILTSTALVFGVSASATAASLGGLSLTPATGLDTTIIGVAFSPQGEACPSAASTVRVVVNGPGGWAAVPLLADTATAKFPVSGGRTTDSFRHLAERYKLTITAGRYDISLLCQDQSGAALAAFDAPVYFTDAVHYQSTKPVQLTRTTTTLSQSAAPTPDAANSVQLTSTTKPVAAGTVQFRDGGHPFGAPQPVSLGRATLPAPLTPGIHTITAVFSPADAASLAGSTSSSMTVVVPALVTTTTALLVTGACDVPANTSLTFRSTTTPAADGKVQLTDGISAVGVPQTLTAGQTTLTVTLPAGHHDVGATFIPSDPTVYAPSSAPTVGCVVDEAKPLGSPPAAAHPGKPVKHKPHQVVTKPKPAVHKEQALASSNWLTSAFYDGSSSQVVAAESLDVSSMTPNQASAVPSPLLAGEEQQPQAAGAIPVPAQVPVLAVNYVRRQGQRVAVLPGLLIVFGVTALVVAGYSKRHRMFRFRTRR